MHFSYFPSIVLALLLFPESTAPSSSSLLTQPTAAPLVQAVEQPPAASTAIRPPSTVAESAQIQRQGTPPQQAARDSRALSKPGTGVIRGRVVATDTGEPVPRARVSLSSVGAKQTPSTLTDLEGRYELTDLAANRYNLYVRKTPYVAMQYGQRRTGERGKPLDLSEGQVLEHVDIALPRGAVIAGRVTDDVGEPVESVLVVPMRLQYFAGRRRLTPAAGIAQANDLGEYRIYGLPPGRYYVGTMPLGGSMTEEGITFAQTYYPGTADQSQAQPIVLKVGQTQANIDFALVASRTARVSGTAMDSSGRPLAGGTVSHTQEMRGSGAGVVMVGGGGATVHTDGRFTFPSMPPGEYTLRVSARNADTGEIESATATVAVAGADVDGILLRTSAGVTVSGRIRLEAEGEANLAPSALSVGSVARTRPVTSSVARGVILNGVAVAGPSSGKVGADWRFSLKGVMPDSNRLTIGGLPESWMLKAVLERDRDVTDSGLDVAGGQDIAGIEVVLTNRVTEVAGSVIEPATGARVDDCQVLIFADDQSRWGEGSRWVASARPDQNSRFTLRALPPGRYLAVALEYLQEGDANDPDVLDGLRSRATHFALEEGEAKVMELTLVRPDGSARLTPSPLHVRPQLARSSASDFAVDLARGRDEGQSDVTGARDDSIEPLFPDDAFTEEGGDGAIRFARSNLAAGMRDATSSLPASAAEQQKAPQAGQVRPGMPEPARAGVQEQKEPAGVIRGRVLSAETRLPLRRARVSVTTVGMSQSRGTTTDLDGRFEFTRLSAGRYTLRASKAGFVTLEYGQRRAREQGRPIDLAEGQTLDKLEVFLPKGSVIAGHVLDDLGQPTDQASVSVMRRQYFEGSRRLVPVANPARTNDLGQYRVAGLPPGAYYVGTTLSTGSEVTSGPAVVFAPVYHPGTPSVHEAQPVTLDIGQERLNVDFTLIAVRPASVSGVVVDSKGRAAASARVSAVRSVRGPSGSMSSSSAGATTAADGRFTLENMAPGEHSLRVMFTSGETGAVETAAHDLTLAGENIENLVLTVSPGVRVAGRIRFDPEGEPNFLSKAISLQVRGVSGSSPLTRSAQPLDDWSFEITGVAPGLRLLAATRLPAGWTVKAVTYQGRDVTDSGLDVPLRGDLTGVQVVFTNRLTEITGSVTNARGALVTDCSIVAFVDDETKWGDRSRFIRVVRPDQNAQFTIRALPPGLYRILAVEYLEEGDANDPEILATWREDASRVTLEEGIPATVELRLAPSQDVGPGR